MPVKPSDRYAEIQSPAMDHAWNPHQFVNKPPVNLKDIKIKVKVNERKRKVSFVGKSTCDADNFIPVPAVVLNVKVVRVGLQGQGGTVEVVKALVTLLNDW